jgi:hypothetical protein
MIEWNHPRTVTEAVERLASELPLKYKVFIASLDRKDLDQIRPYLHSHIANDYGLYTGNRALLRSCRATSGMADLAPEKCPGVIIRALWKELSETHRMRIVKGAGPELGLPE